MESIVSNRWADLTPTLRQVLLFMPPDDLERLRRLNTVWKESVEAMPDSMRPAIPLYISSGRHSSTVHRLGVEWSRHEKETGTPKLTKIALISDNDVISLRTFRYRYTNPAASKPRRSVATNNDMLSYGDWLGEALLFGNPFSKVVVTGWSATQEPSSISDLWLTLRGGRKPSILLFAQLTLDTELPLEKESKILALYHKYGGKQIFTVGTTHLASFQEAVNISTSIDDATPQNVKRVVNCLLSQKKGASLSVMGKIQDESQWRKYVTDILEGFGERFDMTEHTHIEAIFIGSSHIPTNNTEQLPPHIVPMADSSLIAVDAPIDDTTKSALTKYGDESMLGDKCEKWSLGLLSIFMSQQKGAIYITREDK